MKSKNLDLLFLSIALSMALCGCAGPHSPFGGIEMGSGDGEASQIKTQKSLSETVTFNPKRQMLHQPTDFNVTVPVDVNDGVATVPALHVEYNGRNVTRAFLSHSESAIDGKQLKITYRNLRLSASQRHDIAISYRASNSDSYTTAEYLPPTCDLFAQKEIKSTQPFEPKSEYMTLIQKSAKKYEINPNLLAGLIAQESAFDPDAQTYAHAVGLTQITPLAAEEIEVVKPEWKKFSKKDWRTIPSKSIEGGAIYLQFLNDYWTDEETKQLLIEHNVNDMSAIILASYNSGAARVKKNIVDNNGQWLEQPNMKEAFRYVGRVSSYCYHFSGGNE